jgi:phosphoglycolate phosphatase-like HAD superfamily hydrolase
MTVFSTISKEAIVAQTGIDGDYSIIPYTVKNFCKKTVMFDVFDTFIEPPVGLVESVVRPGFKDLLKILKSQNKLIGIHTDAGPSEYLASLGMKWGIDPYVDAYFGDELRYHHNLKGKNDSIAMFRNKDFMHMAVDLGMPEDRVVRDVLIVGDGKSDLYPALHLSMDILIISSYITDPNFNFNNLLKI